MTLSKEFFSVIKRALQEASWKRNEFAMVEAVERELNLLFDHQQRQSHPMMTVSPNQTVLDGYVPTHGKVIPVTGNPINYSPAPAPIIRDETLSTSSTSSPQITEQITEIIKKKTATKKNTNSVAEVPKANGNPNGMSASSEGMAAIDMMLQAGIEQAKKAPIIEKRLLAHVVVEKMPENLEDYETENIL